MDIYIRIFRNRLRLFIRRRWRTLQGWVTHPETRLLLIGTGIVMGIVWLVSQWLPIVARAFESPTWIIITAGTFGWLAIYRSHRETINKGLWALFLLVLGGLINELVKLFFVQP